MLITRSCFSTSFLNHAHASQITALLQERMRLKAFISLDHSSEKCIFKSALVSLNIFIFLSVPLPPNVSVSFTVSLYFLDIVVHTF